MQTVLDSTIEEAIGAAVADSNNHLYTANDLLRISASGHQRYELIRGVLHTMPPAGIEHGDRALRLGAHLQIFVEDHDLGIVVAAETGFYLERDPDTVRAPDAAFIRKDRLSAGPLPSGYFLGAPDLAVEVVSPNDKASEVRDKVQTWLRFGTRLVWLLAAKTRTVTVYRLDGSTQVLTINEILDGEDVVPGFQIPVSRLFR
jgi:Uma2 family endonuclease